ncbi:MAG: S8 family serine peptidase, partial [Candidatus Hodarchaeales archaeon]
LQFEGRDQFLSFTKQYQDDILLLEQVTSMENILPNNQDYNQKVDSIQSHVDSTGAKILHQSGYTGAGVKIGIIDTGVSDHLVEFGSRIKAREVFVTQEYGYSQDISIATDSWGHGTHVAGLAAGSTTGLAPEAEIYSAKIIHSTSVLGAGGGGGEETTLGMLEAIEYLVNNSVDIINISLGQYHNLVDGLREAIIDYTTVQHNIIFCVSAGNSGTIYGDRGSLNNPAPSLQSITSAASNTQGNSLATFSSKGPRPDYSIKPDLTAPGLSISGPSNNGISYVSKSGTSMASPIVAGAAALLIDFLRQENLSYTPGTIKSALLQGSIDMGFDVWRQGAGFINVSASLDILNSTSKVNKYPNLVYLHPRKLPIDPYEVLFTDATIEFNLTIISSTNKNVMIVIPENLSDIINVQKSTYTVNNSMLIPIIFKIPPSKNPQRINGSILIGDALLLIEFEIRVPIARILFEESFNRIVKHGFPTNVDEIQGDTSNTVGMFSRFTRYLAYDNNYSVTPHTAGSLSYDYLSKFDAVILANPFSLASDIYMDWVSTPGLDYIQIPQDTINALYEYVDNGGGLLVLCAINLFYNITAMNEFLSRYDVALTNAYSFAITQSTIINPQNWTEDITSLPFRGNYISATGNKTTVIAENEGKPTIISYIGSTGGRVLLFSSDLIFDNVGFSQKMYGENSEPNQVLAFNAVAWLTEGEFREITTTTVPELDPILFLLVLGAVLILLLFLFRVISKK